MEGKSRETLVTLAFRDLGGRNELTLRHAELPGVADREGHAKGWNSALDKLSAWLER